jgi:hypothetical protein
MATTTSKSSKRQAGASARLRTYNRLRRVEARMDDVFSTARQFMRPHEQILAELTRQVYDTPDFKKLRGIDQSYLSGKSKALMDAFYRYELEWRVSLEGRLMPGSEVPAGRWSEVEAEAGRHVYKRDPARHFAGVGKGGSGGGAFGKSTPIRLLPSQQETHNMATKWTRWTKWKRTGPMFYSSAVAKYEARMLRIPHSRGARVRQTVRPGGDQAWIVEVRNVY